MTLKIAQEEKSQEKKEDIYISFTELFSRKQEWIEEQLAKGHRIFLMPRKGPAIQLVLVSYR